MAKLSEADRAAFAEAYRFYEQFHDMPDSVDAWTECAGRIEEIVPQYENTTLLGELLMACYNAIDQERAKVRRALIEANG